MDYVAVTVALVFVAVILVCLVSRWRASQSSATDRCRGLSLEYAWHFWGLLREPGWHMLFTENVKILRKGLPKHLPREPRVQILLTEQTETLRKGLSWDLEEELPEALNHDLSVEALLKSHTTIELLKHFGTLKGVHRRRLSKVEEATPAALQSESMRSYRVFVQRLGRRKAEGWLVSLSFWIPRKHREAIRGDILEDCHEMREEGFGGWRICAHVLWQFTVAVVALWPQTIGSAVATFLRQILSVKK